MSTLRILIVSLALVALSGSTAIAHVVDVCWRNANDGTLTIYAGVIDHDPATFAGEAVMQTPNRYDDVEYAFPFTGVMAAVPADATCFSSSRCGSKTSEYWMTANVTYLPEGFWNITTRRTDGDGHADPMDCLPWKNNFVEACFDPDSDGACHSPEYDVIDNCPYVSNEDQANSDGDEMGNACDPCVYDAENDADTDGVCGNIDACPDTQLPDTSPSVRLLTNHWADINGDGIFDTRHPQDNADQGPQRDYSTLADTGGCSCDQIIEELHLGEGHRKFGCSIGAMDNWVDYIEDIGLGGDTDPNDPGSPSEPPNSIDTDPLSEDGYEQGFAANGCGCSSQNSSEGALAYLVVLLGLALVTRRRRGRALV